jgi:hypothetical protein
MLEALIAGETNPAKLASLASRQVKASLEELRSRSTIAFCFVFISIRSTLLMPPWPRSTRKWRQTLSLSHRSRAHNVGSWRQEPGLIVTA